MSKNAEINCLPQRYIWKKLSAETTYVMQDLENLKKLSAQPEWRENNFQALIDDGKNVLHPGNHYPPPPREKMVCPLFVETLVLEVLPTCPGLIRCPDLEHCNFFARLKNCTTGCN